MMVDEEYHNSLDEHIMFACPECGKEIESDAAVCPGCGAIFEVEEAPLSMGMEEGQVASSEDYVVGQGIPSLYAEEELGTSLPYTEEKQIAPNHGLSEELDQEDQPLDSHEDALPPTDVRISQEEARSDIGPPQKSIPDALLDYSERRKKRNLYGALFLGLGIVLFVLLWLVVVYDVLVTETEEWFGVDVIFILVGAGILFILGLYMILSYPKSSLSELLSTMANTRPAPSLKTNPKSKAYSSDYPED